MRALLAVPIVIAIVAPIHGKPPSLDDYLGKWDLVLVDTGTSFSASTITLRRSESGDVTGEYVWRFNPDDPELDMGHLLWELPQRIDTSRFSTSETVYAFLLEGAPYPQFLLAVTSVWARVLPKRSKQDHACVTVRSDAAAFASAWAGKATFDALEAQGDLTVEGDQEAWARLKASMQLNLFVPSA